MNRAEAMGSNGTVIDTDATDTEEVKNDGAEDTANAKDNETLDEQGGDAAADGGGETGEVEEISGEEDSETSGEEESAESEPVNKFEEFRESILKQIDERLKPREDAPDQAPVITEEKWKEHEAAFGLPRNTIQAITTQQVKAVRQMQNYVDTKFAEIAKPMALQSLARDPQFSDALRLQKGVDEFLGDYDPKHHSNPMLLKKAVIYARGLQSKRDVQKARNTGEKNLKVITKLKGTASSPSGQKGGGQALTPQQRQAAAMLPGGEAEYKKMKLSSRVIE